MNTATRIGLGLIIFGLTTMNATFSFSKELVLPDQGQSVEIPESSQLESGGSIVTRIGHKFVRGIVNAFTGWAEMPKQMVRNTSREPSVMGLVQGIVEGVGMTFARTTAGLYDVATFAVPLPGHYQPLFEPEYVWQDERESP